MSDCASTCSLIHDWERTMSRFQHDARTPLNVILGFAQVLEAEALPQEAGECVDAIRVAGEDLLQLLEALSAPNGGSDAMMVRAAGLEPARHKANEF